MQEAGSFPAAGWVKGLDPRGALVATFGYSVVVALLERLDAAALALAFSLLFFALGGLDLKRSLKRLALVNGFTLFLWIMLPLTAGGPPLWPDAALGLSAQGVSLAALISLKTNAILLFLLVVLAPVPLSNLGEALYRLRFPEKLVLLLLLTYRFLFLFETELKRLRRSARLRGFEPGTDLHTWRTLTYLIGMLLVRAFGRAQRVQFAMELRGFSGRFRSVHDFGFDRTDGFFLAGVTAALLMTGGLQWLTPI